MVADERALRSIAVRGFRVMLEALSNPRAETASLNLALILGLCVVLRKTRLSCTSRHFMLCLLPS